MVTDMDENNRPAPTGEVNKNNAEGTGESRPRHRRGHRGGKKHNDRAKRAAALNAGNADEKQSAAAPEKQPENEQKKPQKQQKQQKPPKQPSQQANEEKNAAREKNRDRRGNKKNQQQKGKNPRRQPDSFAMKDDIYGDPVEEKALAEWRAKIVLNAEEPTLTSTPAVEQTEESEEPTEIPEGIDLLGGPITVGDGGAKEEQIEVVGIRFRSAGKMYYFDPQGIRVKEGDFAIVETARGPEFGDVCMGNSMVDVSKTVTPLRPLIRVATAADVAQNEENRKKEAEALTICQKKIAAHKLEMKLIDVQYAFDNSKLLFYFSAEGRVDFRELVKDLASVFRTRIELRQIGIRDEAKMLGGFGACGRILCCSTFLPDFAQVSIKMAKEQGLSLNSAKISGMCGRLMCCLRFESDVYAEEIRLTPAHDSLVKTEDGIGTVISSNPLAGTIRVLLKDAPDAPPKQYHRNDVTVLPKEKRGNERPKQEIEDSDEQ